MIDFSSNNYLGLTHHPQIATAMRAAIDRVGAGAGAAGLISGHTVFHERAESAIANWKGTAGAVLLPSGYQANHAAVQALAAIGRDTGGVRFLLDKLCHASLIDAVRGSGAEYRVFPHNGVDKLSRLLADRPAGQLQVVVTESIFSMDGDAADLRAIASLKDSHDFLLLVDDAHGGGVYGEGGAGLASELGVAAAVDLTVTTFSKAAGVAGGAVCGSQELCDAVINHGRGYIYSTAVPAVIAVGVEAAIDVMRREPDRATRVRQLARRVRDELGIAGASPIDSPIVPILLGTEESALTAAAQLESVGLLVVAVRPPTVPKGGSRLRVTLSSAHSDAEVRQLIDAVRAVRERPSAT
ncbi:MAG TPA: aminotransferase class I/II-fold pyridoxal phosphate-dependent enzyme [Tepidisphaeraceae bacterium]|nr:aminotransferase class I/II-fold pyridoxal phosphate-dependent enzyme [Tepidisphaeraceae bacterium]